MPEAIKHENWVVYPFEIGTRQARRSAANNHMRRETPAGPKD